MCLMLTNQVVIIERGNFELCALYDSFSVLITQQMKNENPAEESQQSILSFTNSRNNTNIVK